MSTPEIHIQKEDLSQPELGKWAYALIEVLDVRLNAIRDFKDRRRSSPTRRGRLTGFGRKFKSLFDAGFRRYDVSGQDNFTSKTAMPIPPNLIPTIERRIKISDRESSEGSLPIELILETKFKCKFNEDSKTAKITDYIEGKIHVSCKGRKVKNNREAIELATQLIAGIYVKNEVQIDKIGDLLIPNVPLPEWDR